jgi:hypothetical protein
MSYGSIYASSWWGDANAQSGWGSIYPFNADGGILSIDLTIITADQTTF